MPQPVEFVPAADILQTTLGVPVLYVLLKILHALFLRTPLANPPQSIKSGNYDTPPRVTWYLKQLLIYCIGLTFMKLFVLVLFLALPWLPWVGDWALRWTEGNEALQITFAMFIFPLAMNAVQYWIIDNFIMDKKKDADEQKYTRVGDGAEEGDDGDERRRMIDEDSDVEEERLRKSVDIEVVNEAPLKEVNPTPIPDYAENEAEGSDSSRNKQKKR